MPGYSAVSYRGRGSGRSYPGLREVLAPEYANLSDPQLEQLLEGILGEVSPEDLENFWSSVKKFAKKAAPVFKQALPAVATVAGTALGGPVGGMLGGMAGQALGGAIGAAGGAARGRKPQLRMPGGLPGKLPGQLLGGLAGGLSGGGGAAAPAAAQLLRVISEPQTMQALMAILMGAAGPRQVPVGDTPVPVGAFANLVGTLAQEALSEYHQAVAGESGGIPRYLLGETGEFVVEDPSDPVQRAEALLARLNEADELEAARAAEDEEDDEWAEDEEDADEPRSAAAWADDIDELYDELELAELYAEEG